MNPITDSYRSAPIIHPKSYNPDAALEAEFGRLIHAAIISPSFKRQLLSNPALSIEQGYCGESFHFPKEIKSRINSIRAGSLEDFSTKLLQVSTASRIKESALASYQ